MADDASIFRVTDRLGGFITRQEILLGEPMISNVVSDATQDRVIIDKLC